MSARDDIAAHFTSGALADDLLDAHRAENLTEGIDALRTWDQSVSSTFAPGLTFAIGVLMSVRDDRTGEKATAPAATATPDLHGVIHHAVSAFQISRHQPGGYVEQLTNHLTDAVAPLVPGTTAPAAEAEVLPKADVVAWLVKKAREFRAAGGRERAAQADAIAAMASKIERGAVRSNNLRMLPADFFEVGHTYTRSYWTFQCLAVEPITWANREIRAVGFLTRTDGTGSVCGMDPDDWAHGGWTDTTNDTTNDTTTGDTHA